MKTSTVKTFEELPLFLNAKMIADVLGISEASCYERMHGKDFPVLHIGSRIVVPKAEFIHWVETHVEGGMS